MKTFVFLLVLVVGLSVATFAQQDKPAAPTPAAQATNMVGKTATIKGKVAQVTKRETLIYLNFEKKFPDNVFTAVVFKKNFDEFPDVEKLSGKTVEVSGKVEDYKGKPQIVLNKKDQLRVVE